MDLPDAIFQRRSIKKYNPRPVEFDKVVDVVEAGMAAPSAGNLQICKYIVVVDQGKRQELAESSLQQMWMANAPVHIVVCAEVSKEKQMFALRGERLYAIQDCAASIQNLLLRATSLGLGTCWVGAFDENMVSRICGIPDDVRPQAIITLGYPDEFPEPKEKYPLAQFYFFEEWGGKITDIHRVFRETSPEIASIVKKGKDIVSKISGEAKRVVSKKSDESQ